ncbi:MAG: CooT family nickel-binding protein [Lachnospiraceae bacterium]|jgi:predicted RNA-binding protein|nr:CooT family nickel-binding protein [Lachnospiraceae bacterium]
MCLATAYKNKETKEQIICENITKILIDGDNITMLDILGDEIKVEGKISMVDLTKSVVIIDAA